MTLEELQRLTPRKYFELYFENAEYFLKHHYTIALQSVMLASARMVIDVAKLTGISFRLQDGLINSYHSNTKTVFTCDDFINFFKSSRWKLLGEEKQCSFYGKAVSPPGPQTNGQSSGFKGKIRLVVECPPPPSTIKIFPMAESKWYYRTDLNELAKQMYPQAKIPPEFLSKRYFRESSVIINQDGDSDGEWIYWVSAAIFGEDYYFKKIYYPFLYDILPEYGQKLSRMFSTVRNTVKDLILPKYRYITP